MCPIHSIAKLLMKGRSDFKREKESDEKVYLFKSSVSMSTQADAKGVTLCYESEEDGTLALRPLTFIPKLQFVLFKNSLLLFLIFRRGSMR